MACRFQPVPAAIEFLQTGANGKQIDDRLGNDMRNGSRSDVVDVQKVGAEDRSKPVRLLLRLLGPAVVVRNKFNRKRSASGSGLL